MWESVNSVKVVCQTDGDVVGALTLIFREILIKWKGLKLNPVSITYFVIPCSALCPFIRQILLKKLRMDVVGVFMEIRRIETNPTSVAFACVLSISAFEMTSNFGS